MEAMLILVVPLVLLLLLGQHIAFAMLVTAFIGYYALLGGALPVQQREVVVGGLYMSHSDYEASFAMGKADSATLIIDWRDGRRTVTVGIVVFRFREERLQRRPEVRVVPRRLLLLRHGGWNLVRIERERRRAEC